MMTKNCFVKGNIRVLCRIRKSESTNCLSATKTTVKIDSSRNEDPPVLLLSKLFLQYDY